MCNWTSRRITERGKRIKSKSSSSSRETSCLRQTTSGFTLASLQKPQTQKSEMTMSEVNRNSTSRKILFQNEGKIHFQIKLWGRVASRTRPKGMLKEVLQTERKGHLMRPQVLSSGRRASGMVDTSQYLYRYLHASHNYISGNAKLFFFFAFLLRLLIHMTYTYLIV